MQNRKELGAEIERTFEKDVFPLIGNKHIAEVTRVDVKAILDRPLNRKSKRMAMEILIPVIVRLRPMPNLRQCLARNSELRYGVIVET